MSLREQTSWPIWLPSAAAMALLAATLLFSRCPTPMRVATLNLENYPKHDRQGPAAMALIEDLGVAAVALQEITQPERLAAQARESLGPHWRFAWTNVGSRQRVGVLYDGSRLQVIDEIVHRETLLHRGAKPAYEVVVQPIGGGAPLHLITVHLKARDSGQPIRAKQLAALRPILKQRMEEGKRVVLMGDLNSTGEADRRLLDTLARDAEMSWGSRGLPCTSYWARKDGCLGFALDHVISWAAPRAVDVGGACESDGCRPGEQCPIYYGEISDHCPVIVDLPTW
ncbi:MAG: hypothetical protein AAFV53_34985 [Myxococcota bacterium]